ncbi:MAG: twin-arginine translocase TatA/TatE family subunit [Vampirovibrionales bacterium]|nr:twin-arginine translocase TatA/TatE family subunit [Vampirovibrionales bacterium]
MPTPLAPTLLPMFLLPSLGFGELAIIFVIVLILFGPGKLPGVFKAMGEGVKQFKDASKGVLPTDDSKDDENDRASAGAQDKAN